MTAAFDALVATGRGPLEFSFVIEGCPYVFVTSEDMAGAYGDGRTKIPGLRRDNLGLSERVIIQEAEHEFTIDQVMVDEVGGAWLGKLTEVLTTIADRVGALDLTLGSLAGATTMTVADSSFYPDGYYHLGTECVQVTARPSGTTATVVRGVWDTTRQEHPVTVGARAQASEVYTYPTGWAYRRCWLYAHTESELSSGGTIIWRGVLSREPALSGDDSLSWSFAIEPRTRVLEAPIAGGLEELRLRGASYPGTAPLYIAFRRHTDATAASAHTDTTDLRLAGHFETQEEFCAALQDALEAHATLSTWGVAWDVRAYPDTWDLAITIAASPRYVSITGGSRVDGYFDDAGRINEDPGPGIPQNTTFPGLPVVSASTTYVARWNDAREGSVPSDDRRRLPRHNFGGAIVGSDTDIASYPPTRIYVESLGSLTGDDDLTLTPAMVTETGAPYTDEAPPQILNIASVDAVTTSITCSTGDDVNRPPRICASGATQPTLVASSRYADGDGDLEAFRADLVARGPAVSNRGLGPLLTSDDVASWADAVTEQSAGRAFLAHRVYTFAQSVKAIEVLREEWKLYGLIPYLDADAKLAVRPFKIDTTEIEFDIGADQILTDETLGSVTGEADGVVTVVEVSRDYDPAEDKHSDRTITFRGVSAIARVKAERKLTIAPKSRAVGSEPEYEDLVDQASSIITVFGDRRTQVCRIDVGLTVFGIRVGDIVALTSGALPSAGARTDWSPGSGMVARRGIVIGRSWAVSEGHGSIEVLLHELDVAGYTPSARVTGASGATTSWTLTCTQSHYSDGDDLGHFASGQAVRLIEWDASSPTIREGVVNGAPTATTIAVTLASSWAGMGGATYYTLIYDTSDDADTTAVQLESAFVADGGGRIPLASGSSPARIFAP